MKNRAAASASNFDYELRLAVFNARDQLYAVMHQRAKRLGAPTDLDVLLPKFSTAWHKAFDDLAEPPR